MLRKLRGRPAWYQVWALLVGLAAAYMLVRVFTVDGLGRVDYVLLVFVHASVLLDNALYPTGDGAGPNQAQNTGGTDAGE